MVLWELTHCGLVRPYGDINLGQHLFRYWFVAYYLAQHQASTLTLCIIFFRGNENIYLHLTSFFHTGIALVIEILCQLRQELKLISNGQYHWYRCPGDTRSQSISNHDIDYVEPNKPGDIKLQLN